jgi:hypothetical protein
MDPGMPMMPDPSGGAPSPSMAPPPQIDPAKLAMIRQILMQRMMQQGGGMMQQPQPPLLGTPPASMGGQSMNPSLGRPASMQMIPGQPPFGRGL